MRRQYIIVLTLVLLLIVPASLSAFTLKDTWHRSFDVREGVEFILANVNGGIEIEGWERNEIDVLAEIKKLLEKLEFKVDAGPDLVEIRTDRPKIRQDGFLSAIFGDKSTVTIRYTVKVPRRTYLDIENTNGGIRAYDVEGTFDFQTVNGAIKIDSFRGQGEARTVNGGIECSIEAFPRDGDLSLKTTNGGIELGLPEQAGGRLEAKTVNGGIDLGIELREKVRIKRSSVRGIIGDGSGTIYLKTVNGGISIEPY
jgi:hypothetical protein